MYCFVLCFVRSPARGFVKVFITAVLEDCVSVCVPLLEFCVCASVFMSKK